MSVGKLSPVIKLSPSSTRAIEVGSSVVGCPVVIEGALVSGTVLGCDVTSIVLPGVGIAVAVASPVEGERVESNIIGFRVGSELVPVIDVVSVGMDVPTAIVGSTVDSEVVPDIVIVPVGMGVTAGAPAEGKTVGSAV